MDCKTKTNPNHRRWCLKCYGLLNDTHSLSDGKPQNNEHKKQMTMICVCVCVLICSLFFISIHFSRFGSFNKLTATIDHQQQWVILWQSYASFALCLECSAHRIDCVHRFYAGFFCSLFKPPPPLFLLFNSLTVDLFMPHLIFMYWIPLLAMES